MLDVTHNAKNILKTDFKGIGKLYQKYGINEMSPNASTKLTNALIKDGYEGLSYGEEVVIFNPKNVSLK